MSDADISIVRLEPTEDALVVRVACPVMGERESGVIEREVLASLAGSGSRVAFDCSRVTMIPSVGLGMLVRVHNACKHGGGAAALFGLDTNLTKLLKISAFDRLFLIADTQDKAVKKLR